MAARQTLVLLHAVGRAGRSWRHSTDQLRQRYDVLTPDLPGFSPGTTFSFPAAVDAVADLVHGRGPVHVCGHSLGAMVAAHLAAARPDLVDRLVLAAISLAPGRSEPGRIRFFRRVPAPLVRTFADVTDRAAWLSVVDALDSADLVPVLPSITAPTLVVCGTNDTANLPDSRAAARLIPGSRLMELPHAGHSWPVSKPHIFQKMLAGYLG